MNIFTTLIIVAVIIWVAFKVHQKLKDIKEIKEIERRAEKHES